MTEHWQHEALLPAHAWLWAALGNLNNAYSSKVWTSKSHNKMKLSRLSMPHNYLPLKLPAALFGKRTVTAVYASAPGSQWLTCA